MKKICFVLPDHSGKPVGGYKMVFEYANRLVADGYQVGILFLNLHPINRYNLPMSVKKVMVNYLTMVEPKWFELDQKVEKISGTSHNYLRKINKYDCFIATSCETVYPLLTLKGNKGNCYFIQGFETWCSSEEELKKTFSAGLKNIVIASWLKRIVDACSHKESTLIPNPLDLNIYQCWVPNDKRYRHSVGFLYSTYEIKGCNYSFEAVKQLKEKYPDLKVYVFGNPVRPKEYPAWIEYTHNASAQQTVEIYNRCAVFICSTIEEGYGLTGLEAMACGSALATTEYSGVKEYAIDGYNCKMSPIRNVERMVENVVSLFENESERMMLINNGLKSVRKFDWMVALEKFKEVIEDDK